MRLRLLFLTLALAFRLFYGGSAGFVHAQDPGLEYSIKALQMVKLSGYIEWSTETQAALPKDFAIAILGDDPFGSILEALSNKQTVHSRKIAVKRIQNIDDLSPAHVVFISGSEKENLPRILESLKGKNVLTVSDSPGFADQGVMLNFFIADNTVRFEINLDAATDAKLKIPAQVLSLKKVRVIRKAR